MFGAAILACELEGLPYSTVHLSKLKIHATGKGNAKKPEMQATAKAHWEKDLGEDEADAAWAAAYALDCGLFYGPKNLRSCAASADKYFAIRGNLDASESQANSIALRVTTSLACSTMCQGDKPLISA
ncbi:hypothetical protein [Bradyrhizobium vignae]|uniref:hypothetical protein n=1 Tax=Bradyrhizobium vignae TaxID=1549949 RepID=UPI00100C22B1|nr:hypothetical protein [Bradyrhizobium vignae]RXG93248.1 hypothetical protein EAV90_26750 [Bradyrhizobium vignae]